MTKSFAVRITPPAEDDLSTIHDYISTHGSPQIADRLLDKIVERLRSLNQFPHRGSVVPELAGLKGHFRQISHNPYRCIYAVEEQVVIVVAVLDSRRDVAAVLEQRLLQGQT